MENKKKTTVVFFQYRIELHSGRSLKCVNHSTLETLCPMIDQLNREYQQSGIKVTEYKPLNYKDALRHLADLKVDMAIKYKRYKWYKSHKPKMMRPFMNAYKEAQRIFDEALEIFNENYITKLTK